MVPFGRAGARAWLGLLLFLAAFLGAWRPAAATEPLFTFVQISDSQPETPEQWARFQQVLDTITQAGSPGALLPRQIDFVLFAGDLVSHADTQSEWVQFVDTIDASLTANSIPYRAVPGNHDQQGFGIGFYELFIADDAVWDTDTATVVGQNGPVVHTGWSGLRMIGFNNSNGAWNQISAEDLASISARVMAAAAADENVLLLGHHPHDEFGVVPLGNVLENPSVCCYVHGHSGSPGTQRGLDLVVHPDIWDLNSHSIVNDGALLYYEAYATELRVHPIALVLNATTLPAATSVALAHPLRPETITPPAADFSASPASGAAPLDVLFTDLSTGNPTSWLWSFGDGATSTEADPTHTYADAGVYDVSLTASNAAGSSTKLRAGLVTALPPPPAQTFLPTADAKVKSSSPTSNYGTEPDLRVRAGDTTYRSYLRFTLSGLEGSAVLSATLRLYATDPSDDGGALYQVASEWTESGITWETAPTIGGAPLAGGAGVIANQWREIDVSSVVLGNGSYAFALDGPSGNSAYYSSREGANPPQLVVQTDPSTIPVPDFGASPTQGPAPLAVAFTDLSTGGPTNWLWSFGDGATATGQSPSHSYESPGVYDVSLFVSNANGSGTLTRAAFVQVSAPVPPVADFSASPLAGEAPLAVAFTDLSAGSPTSWLWSFGDGGTSTSRNPSHTYSAPGLYDVTLVAANAAGSDTLVRAGYVAVAEPPPRQTFVPAADARVSSGSPNANYGDDDGLRARAGSTIMNSYLRFDLVGFAGLGVVSAKLRLFVTDASASGGSVYRVGNGWSESQITWSNAPAISGAPLASLGAVAAGEWVEFDVTDAVGGDGSVSLAVASTSSNSVYYSSHEGTNSPELVVETGTAVAPTADFGGAPLQGPAPLSVAFDDFSTGGPASWLWSFGDGATSTSPSPSHTYAAPGIYDVSLTVSNAEGSDSLTRAAFVDVSPPLPIETFLAAADAKVNSTQPDVNYGAEPNLRVKTSSTGTWRSFLRFDVAGLDAPVVRATLRLHVDDGSRNGGALHVVSDAWSEDAITWNTAPALDAAPIASLGQVATAVWVELDVTSIITGNGSYAFGLGGGSSNTAYYGSRESTNEPQLVIEMAE